MSTQFIPHYMGYKSDDKVKGSTQKVAGYKLYLPDDFYDIDNVQISFLKIAKQIVEDNNDIDAQEELFLNVNYVFIKKK